MRLAACSGVFTRLYHGVRKLLCRGYRGSTVGGEFHSLLFCRWEGMGVGKAN